MDLEATVKKQAEEIAELQAQLKYAFSAAMFSCSLLLFALFREKDEQIHKLKKKIRSLKG